MAKHGNPCHTREMSIHKGRHDTYYTYYGPAGEPPLLQQPVANFSNHRIQHTHGVLFLVVVFIVNIDDLPFDDLEGKAPVGRYAKTPDFFAVAGQLMGFRHPAYLARRSKSLEVALLLKLLILTRWP